MSDQQPPRPRQVTMAAVMIIAGSLAVVLTVFGQLSSLNSLDSTRALEEALSQPPADGLGIGLEAARTGLRVMAMISAACASAAAILGYSVMMQRSRSARIGLAVVAAPLFVTGIASGGILSSVVVAASVMLWLQPARDWFDGVAARETPHRSAASRTPRPQAPAPPAAPTGPTAAPAPYSGSYGSARPAPVSAPHPPAPPEDRPSALVWACLVTWSCTALAAALMAVVTLALIALPDLFEEVSRQTPELAEQGITESQVVTAAVVSTLVVVAWSAGAAFLAAQAWRRRPWARIALIASAGTAGLLSLLGALASFLLVVPVAACAAVVVLLCRTEVRWWLR